MTTYPGESAEYRTARDHLLEQEVRLRREMETLFAPQASPGKRSFG